MTKHGKIPRFAGITSKRQNYWSRLGQKGWDLLDEADPEINSGIDQDRDA
jgi:hypothetical protein